MFGLLKGLRSLSRARRVFSARPSVEALEDRRVMSVTYHGGNVLPHVEVQGLYIGDQWSGNSTLNGQANRLEGFLNTIVHSSYMDTLGNAGYGVGRGSSAGGIISLASLSSGSSLNDSTVRSWLSTYISNHSLRAADANTLYVCFVEPNVKVVNDSSYDSNLGRYPNGAQDFRGYHTAFAGPGGVAVRYAVLSYPGGSTSNEGVSFLSSIDSITKSASHEIAEAVTDPDINYSTKGWYDDNFINPDKSKGGEIGDIKNDRVVYLGGYAMQRVIDRNDYNMAPAGATSNIPVNFVLQYNGTLSSISGGASTSLLSNIASISDQGIDNQGWAIVDAVTTGGDAYEVYYGGGSNWGWRYLGGNVKMAKASQGVSYVLSNDGTVWEHEGGGDGVMIDSGDASIDAGTDRYGVNMFIAVTTGGNAWERSDSTGWHYIDWNVRVASAGQQGNMAFLYNNGNATSYNEAAQQFVFRGSNVAQITAGSDQYGNPMLDILYNGGAVYELRQGVFSQIANASSIGRAHNGVVDIVFSWGGAYAHDQNGWTYLLGNAAAAA